MLGITCDARHHLPAKSSSDPYSLHLPTHQTHTNRMLLRKHICKSTAAAVMACSTAASCKHKRAEHARTRVIIRADTHDKPALGHHMTMGNNAASIPRTVPHHKHLHPPWHIQASTWASPLTSLLYLRHGAACVPAAPSVEAFASPPPSAAAPCPQLRGASPCPQSTTLKWAGGSTARRLACPKAQAGKTLTWPFLLGPSPGAGPVGRCCEPLTWRPRGRYWGRM
mmetsp:Transcript_7011/g.15419  ORF Transcript_7011/g.15419 Transcript_7011/m.15419 type:complete len:225 (+) Transcript_7011:411-1085(+)